MFYSQGLTVWLCVRWWKNRKRKNSIVSSAKGVTITLQQRGWQVASRRPPSSQGPTYLPFHCQCRLEYSSPYRQTNPAISMSRNTTMPRYTTCLAYLHKIPWTSQSSVRIRGEGRVQRTRSKCHKQTATEGDTLVRPGSWETAVVQDEFRDQRGKSVKAEAGGNLNNADCEGYFPADFCWLCVNYIFKRQTDSLPLFPLPPTLPILLIGYCGRSSDRRWWGLSNLRVFSKVATHGRARDTLAAAWILVSWWQIHSW